MTGAPGALQALLLLLLLESSGCYARSGVSTAATALTAGEQGERPAPDGQGRGTGSGVGSALQRQLLVSCCPAGQNQ